MEKKERTPGGLLLTAYSSTVPLNIDPGIEESWAFSIGGRDPSEDEFMGKFTMLMQAQMNFFDPDHSLKMDIGVGDGSFPSLDLGKIQHPFFNRLISVASKNINANKVNEEDVYERHMAGSGLLKDGTHRSPTYGQLHGSQKSLSQYGRKIVPAVFDMYRENKDVHSIVPSIEAQISHPDSPDEDFREAVLSAMGDILVHSIGGKSIMNEMLHSIHEASPSKETGDENLKKLIDGIEAEHMPSILRSLPLASKYHTQIVKSIYQKAC